MIHEAHAKIFQCIKETNHSRTEITEPTNCVTAMLSAPDVRMSVSCT